MANNNLQQLLNDVNQSLKKAENLSLHNIVAQIDELIASVEQNNPEPDYDSYREIIQDINQIISQYEITPPNDVSDQQTQDTDVDLNFSLDDNSTQSNPFADKPLSKLAKVTRGVGQEEGTDEIDGVEENPDRQGLIRQIPKAHLVYKRQTPDNTYEELWVYNISQVGQDMKIRQAILADTNIPANATISPEGDQRYELWTCGNAECLKIMGLPE